MTMTGAKVRLIAGWVILVLIGGMLIMAGVTSLFFMTEENLKHMAERNLAEERYLIAVGTLISAVLLLIPRTSSLGVLLVSGFFGGTICFHMAYNEPYIMQSCLLALTWLGAWLRNPATFHSFYPSK